MVEESINKIRVDGAESNPIETVEAGRQLAEKLAGVYQSVDGITELMEDEDVILKRLVTLETENARSIKRLAKVQADTVSIKDQVERVLNEET